MNHKLIRISIGLALIAGLIGCATTSPEMELAARQQEDETLARLQRSYSDDIAAAATSMARGRQ